MPSIELGKAARPLPSAELNLGGTSTAEAQFKTAAAEGSTAAAATLVCYMPGSNTMKQRRFTVRVGGRLTGGGTTNFTGKLYWGTSSTIGSNTNIATTGAIAVNSASATWELEIVAAWDSTSQKITGLQKGWVNATAVAQVIVTNVPTAVDLSAESTSNGWTVTGTFSSGFAGNVAYVDYFEVLTQ